MISCILMHCLNTALWTVKNRQPCFCVDKRYQEQVAGFKKKSSISSIFRWDVQTCNHTFNSKRSATTSLHQTFVSSLLAERNTPHFTGSLTATVTAWQYSCCQWWSTEEQHFIRNLCQHRKKSLRLQALPPNQNDASVPQKQGQTSRSFPVLAAIFKILIRDIF